MKIENYDEIKEHYKLVDYEHGWHFPHGKETIKKAIEYADKSYHAVNLM